MKQGNRKAAIMILAAVFILGTAVYGYARYLHVRGMHAVERVSADTAREMENTGAGVDADMKRTIPAETENAETGEPSAAMQPEGVIAVDQNSETGAAAADGEHRRRRGAAAAQGENVKNVEEAIQEKQFVELENPGNDTPVELPQPDRYQPRVIHRSGSGGSTSGGNGIGERGDAETAPSEPETKSQPEEESKPNPETKPQPEAKPQPETKPEPESKPGEEQKTDQRELRSDLLVFGAQTAADGTLRYAAGSALQLPERALVGLQSTGENSGRELPLRWEGEHLTSLQAGLAGSYELTAVCEETLEIHGTDYGKAAFAVRIIVE